MITCKQMSLELYDDVRRFIIKHFKSFEVSPNWLIDRLEFTKTVSAKMSGTDDRYFEEHNRLWYDNDELIAIVNTEGELNGEAFFQISTYDLPDQVLNEMFDFVEERLMIEMNGKNKVLLRIAKEFDKAVTIAKERGFIKENWEEIMCGMDISNKLDVKLPDGYKIVSRNSITSMERSDAHRLSFGYEADEALRKNCADGFDEMMLQADYKEELDLFVINPTGEVVSFSNVWFDEYNKIAILEPVGTIKSEQKKGLGRAVINEGINRVLELGANKLFVGSDQEFYKRIGFEPVFTDLVFSKEK